MCSVTQDRIIVDVKKPIDYKNVFETEIKVGQFSRHQVWPTCGIATSESVIGEFDDIRYFNIRIVLPPTFSGSPRAMSSIPYRI